MKSKKSFYVKKISAVALAFAVGITSTAGNTPAISQAASTFSITKKATIGAGETYQLATKGNTKGITFKSSDKKIVSVSKSGKIKGKKSGKATITAKVNKKSKKCVVTVKKAPKGIKITNGNLELYTESQEQLSVKFTSGYSNKITFKSGNKAVAKVSTKGLVTAVGEGKTTITATTFNRKKATITCKVVDDQKETATPTTEPTATVSVTPTVSTTAVATAVVSTTPSNIPANTEAATSTPIATETATSVPSNVPEPTYTATVVPSDIPTPTETATLVPSSVPAPTNTAPVAPTITPVAGEAATVTPGGISVSPSATPEVATTSAVISKIDGNVIYVNENQSILNLTKCITYFKAGHQITLQELAVGDTITITYSGLTAETFPSLLVACEKIEVTKSESKIVHATTIYDISNSNMYTNYPCFLTYDSSVAKIYKDGQEIAWSDLKEGDTVRINYTYYGSKEPGTTGFVELINTIVVLDDSFSDAKTITGVFTKKNDNTYYLDNGTYGFTMENDTIVKVNDGTKEYVYDALLLGKTITVFYTEEIKDGDITWLMDCKKVVLDDTIPRVTPTVTPTVAPSTTPTATTTPTVMPTYPVMSPAPLKPVIYLYPEEETEVSVDLDFQGDFTYTYPYTKDGNWDVVAKPDGTIINKADNNEYSYLFWEGVAWDFTADFSEGFCVKGEDTTEFLRTVLSQMGLTPKEYNEFIVYWAPQLQNNAYNLISFQTENYEQMAPLNVNPAPDSMLRVYMAYKPLTEAVDIPAQTFTPFERKGFTVVEWGGCVINDAKVK